MLVDTHAHLYEKAFFDDFEQMMARADERDVKKIFIPNVDSSTIKGLVDICHKYPGRVYGMMGLHPCSVKENYKDELAEIFGWFSKEKFYAVGEIGIDLYWDKTWLKEQIDAFSFQLQKSIEFNLPVAIHARESFDEIYDVVSSPEFKQAKGIFHCFSGNEEQAFKLIELGYYLGIGGVCTFKNGGLDIALKNVPLEKMILETDAPYLAPVPYRGKRNESGYLKEISQRLADIKETSVEKVAEITTANANHIFGV
jgi:TatD DNase family protein